MPLKDRLSTMLHISTGQMQHQSDYKAQSASGTSPPQTPASIHTSSTAVTDPLSSPNTVLSSSVYAKSSPDTVPTTRETSRSTSSPDHDAVSNTQAAGGASRLANRLSAFPKRMFRHKQTVSQPTNTLSAFQFPSPGRPISSHHPDPSQTQTQTQTQAPPLPAPLAAPARSATHSTHRAPGWRGHKHTRSAAAAAPPTPASQTSSPAVVASPQPQRPLTYHHQPTHQTPFLYAAQSEFIAGPHPGQRYDPFQPRPPPSPTTPERPAPKSATDCWDDDPPHVRKRLQNRHWEVLFGDFSWATASAKRHRASAVAPERGGVSPRSRSPSCGGAHHDERDSFWTREPHERGRPRMRTPTQDSWRRS